MKIDIKQQSNFFVTFFDRFVLKHLTKLDFLRGILQLNIKKMQHLKYYVNRLSTKINIRCENLTLLSL
jgi:hypothetical protein